MHRMNRSPRFLGMIVAAAIVGAAPVCASEVTTGVSESSVRDTVIAMSLADAALPVAVATRVESTSLVAALAKPEASGAMAAMRPGPARRARAVLAERPVRMARNDYGCPTYGCAGRPFVLMLGIGY